MKVSAKLLEKQQENYKRYEKNYNRMVKRSQKLKRINKLPDLINYETTLLPILKKDPQMKRYIKEEERLKRVSVAILKQIGISNKMPVECHHCSVPYGNNCTNGTYCKLIKGYINAPKKRMAEKSIDKIFTKEAVCIECHKPFIAESDTLNTLSKIKVCQACKEPRANRLRAEATKRRATNGL